MLYGITPLAKIIYESLSAALEETQTDHPTKPITAWKSTWLEKNAQKKSVFKDRKHLEKLKAVSFVYYEYVSLLEKSGLFDYDDMIMQVVHAMEVHDDLKFNLQEKYLYIMVDEFQDTNVAQLRILHNLTDNPVNEGMPNLLVVGDDDQAVYGFQGADASTITNFADTYPKVHSIVLTENYRSGEAILAASRATITQGTDRLETRFPELDKALKANKKVPSTVELWQTASLDDERYTIVQQIKADIDSGADPSSIAVLSRRHTDIQSLLPFFRSADIPLRYEKEESVLDSPPIVALEQLARVIIALAEGDHALVQSLLPELLAHPAWKLSPEALWRLSLDAYTSRKNWMEIMATTPQFAPIYTWIVAQAQAVYTTSLEPLLDTLIGKPEGVEQFSPFYDYFFSTETLKNTPDLYLEYLGALRTIRARLREYQPGQGISLVQFVEFIDLHHRLGTTITVKQASIDSSAPAVQLLTAHKAKGLEFDTVYVFNSVDSVWGQTARVKSRSISYPANLPLAPSGATADERLRLFYVAMTRAERRLIMTYAALNDSQKATNEADFLLELGMTPIQKPAEQLSDHTKTAEIAWYQPLVQASPDLKKVLAPHIENFRLSATSLHTFLDVSRGGPEHFLLNNLLHFPQTKSASASYGTAVHWTMQQAHTHLLTTGEQKPLEDSLHDFEIALEKERLDEVSHRLYLQKGSEHIPAFLRSGVLPMSKTQKAEVTFNHQDVRVGDARITGSLDMIDVDKKEKVIAVTDYKTGRPAQTWKGSDVYEKIKLHTYKQQLVFYKILVENSAEYAHYTVPSGTIAFIEPTRANESIILPLEISNEDVERTTRLIQAVWKHIVELDLPDTSHYSQDITGIIAFEQDLIDGIV